MTLEQLSSLGEIISAIAVVASLVALAFQMRQNTKAVYAQAARDAEAVWGTFYFEVGKDKELSLLTEKLLLSQSSDEFSKEEYARTIFLLRSIWSNLQSEHSLALDHSLRPEVWQRRVKWIRGLMQIPIVREFIEHEISQQNVDPRLVEQIMAQGDKMQMGRLFDRK